MKLKNVMIVVKDIERSKQFYKELFQNHAMELYFEERNFTESLEKLEHYEGTVRYAGSVIEYPWGKKILRMYAPDGTLIEVGTP